MATTALQKVGAVSATMAGGVGGALAGGPIGLAVGLAGGAAIDLLRARMKKPAAGASPTAVALAATPAAIPPAVHVALATPSATPGLPPGADKAAATSAVHLMLLGQPAEVAPAKSWLSGFQKSVGLPATGALDATTRQLLILATAGGVYDASKLPAKTILG
jgi:hypothetical protein